MRTTDVDILMVPGWSGSGPDHWQSRWQRNLKTARRVEQEDWDRPDKDKWVGNIIREVAASARPAVLVAHSLGVHAVALAAKKPPRARCPAPFSLPPRTLRTRKTFRRISATRGPQAASAFARCRCRSSTFPRCCWPPPTTPTPASSGRGRSRLPGWGSGLIEIGAAGHVNAASGHGPWPDGVLRFGGFLKQLG